MTCPVCEDLRRRRDKLIATAMQIPDGSSDTQQKTAATRRQKRKLTALWNGLRLNVVQHQSICPEAGEMLRFC
jgi:hypothetical protein